MGCGCSTLDERISFMMNQNNIQYTTNTQGNVITATSTHKHNDGGGNNPFDIGNYSDDNDNKIQVK
jgi:hypothetical protein